MNISIKLDEVGKIGVISLDGPIGETEHRILSTLIDQFVYGLALNGWVLLTGSRTRAPAIVDRESVLLVMAQRAMREQAEPDQEVPASTPHSPAPVPMPPVVDPNATPEEKRASMFRFWAGDTRPPDEPPPPKDPA